MSICSTPDLALRTQHSLKAEFERSGIGLHSGLLTKVRVLLAHAGIFRYCVRLDLADEPFSAERLDAAYERILSTQLRG